MVTFTESVVEEAALAWLRSIGWRVVHGPDIAPDVMLFVNGLPLAVLELKNAADADATIWTAYQQLQTYQAQVPALFATNAVRLASDEVRVKGAEKLIGRAV